MYYIERVNAKSGEFVLCNTENSKRVYFDVNPNYYGKGEAGIVNSLKKQFPIPRRLVLEMVKKVYFQPWWKKHLKSMKEYAKGAFAAGAVDSVYDEYGEIFLSRYD